MSQRIVWLCAVAAFACGPLDASLSGAHRFAELEALEADRLVRTEGARLIQIRERGSPTARIAGAEMVAPDQAIPDEWRSETRARVLLAHDAATARRLAARLVRDGLTRVFVVRGGIAAWLDLHSSEIQRVEAGARDRSG